MFVIIFIIAFVFLTVLSAHKIIKIHQIKKNESYNFHKNDIRFENFKEVLILSFFCMIAAMICACTGISGGMVLGPLFLKYNMHP